MRFNIIHAAPSSVLSHVSRDLYAGKLYTLVTGANERRWGKVQPQLETVARSFVVSTKY